MQENPYVQYLRQKPFEKNSFLPLKVAARQGFEPRQNEPKSFVLPLHNRAIYVKYSIPYTTLRQE